MRKIDIKLLILSFKTWRTPPMLTKSEELDQNFQINYSPDLLTYVSEERYKNAVVPKKIMLSKESNEENKVIKEGVCLFRF